MGYTFLTERSVRLMAVSGFVQWSENPITLKSGRQSHVYVNGRDDVTENIELLRLLADDVRCAAYGFAKEAGDDRRLCFIGIPVAATPLAQQAAVDDPHRNYPSHANVRWQPSVFRVMRQEKKGHGAHHRWVDGEPDHEQHLYVIVDNVVTDGASKRQTVERLREDGYDTDDTLWVTLVNRGGPGVMAEMAAMGIPAAVYCHTLQDILGAFSTYEIWPEERIRRALTEFQ